MLGPEHPDTLVALNNLALDMVGDGRYAEAEPLFRQVWDASKRVLGKDHPSTLVSVNNLALDIRDQGRYAEAEPLMAQVLAAQLRRAEGAANDNTLRYSANLGYLRSHNLHKYAEGYPDLKAAADGTWTRMRDVRVAANQESARKILKDARWIFIGQIEAAWGWGHAP